MTIDPVAHNRDAWDKQVDAGDEWTRPVTPDVIARARNGDWSVVLIGYVPVAREWFPADLHGVDVLGLASGGGQQGPVLAAAGANVTIFDNSPKQLAQDRMVAEREGLAIRTELGDMRDLSVFDDASFDLVFHPVSNCFCPDILPVWRECFRVLRPGGSLLAGFLNPDLYIFDREAEDTRGDLIVRHKLPYSDLTHMTEEERARFVGDGPLEYSHTLGDQIGGQLAAGFTITAFTEAPHHAGITAKYMPGYFATRALKPGQFVVCAIECGNRSRANVDLARRAASRSRRRCEPATESRRCTMMYMFLICYDPAVPLGPNDPKSLQPEHAALGKQLRDEGRQVSGGALMPFEMAPALRVQGTRRYGTDGAFTERKEVVGGYYVVECKDASDAESVGMRIPVASNAWVQVRQLLLYDND